MNRPDTKPVSIYCCSSSEMEVFFRAVLENFSKNDGRMPPDGRRYPQIRISDTFLSDTLRETILELMLAVIRRHSLPPALVMLLDPYCPIATIRAGDLPPSSQTQEILTARERAIRGHRRLLRAIRSVTGEANLAEVDEMTLEDLTLSIQSEGAGLIVLRYINCLTTLPLFLIGNYAFNGLLTPSRSTTQMPWDVGNASEFFATREAVFEAGWKREDQPQSADLAPSSTSN